MDDALSDRRGAARDFTRIALSLFLPLTAGVWLLGRLGLERAGEKLHARRMLTAFLPFLVDARPSALAVVLATAATALALFLAAPARARGLRPPCPRASRAVQRAPRASLRPSC